jgi:hypothetical protein
MRRVVLILRELTRSDRMTLAARGLVCLAARRGVAAQWADGAIIGIDAATKRVGDDSAETG